MPVFTDRMSRAGLTAEAAPAAATGKAAVAGPGLFS